MANFEDGVHFTGAWEQRPEGVELCHNAANSPLVYRRAVGGGPQQHLWSSVPGDQIKVCRIHRLADVKASATKCYVVCVYGQYISRKNTVHIG